MKRLVSVCALALAVACSPQPTQSGQDSAAASSDAAGQGGADSAATGESDSGAVDSGAVDSGAGDGGGDDSGVADATSPDTTATGCPKGCDDGNPCTDDSCVASQCTHAANAAPCDDGKPCTGGDVCAGGVCAGQPTVWQKTYGGSGEDVGRAARGLADGGLVVAGHTTSGGVSGKAKGGRDAWLLRIDAQGEVVWEQVLGNDLDQTAFDVTAWDSKVVAVGTWREHGDQQPRGWLHVTDEQGKALGSHVFKESEVTELHAVAVSAAAQKPTTRMVVAGYQESSAGDIAMAVSRIDPQTLKPLWIKSHGSTGFDAAWDVAALHNGHIALVGDTAPGGSGPHVWLLELDEAGAVVWQRTYFSDGEDTGWSIVAHPDQVLQNKGYTVAGTRKKPGATHTAAWLMRADAAGKDQWQQSVVAPGGAAAYALARVGNLGYVAVGRSALSTGTDEALLWRTDSVGATTWSLSAGVASGSVGHGVAVWPDAYGLVGQSGAGKAANLLVVRATTAGKLTCP